MIDNAKQDKSILTLLFGGMLFFSLGLIWIRHFLPNDDQLFQVIAGMLTAFSGSFFTYITKIISANTTNTTGPNSTNVVIPVKEEPTTKP